MDPRTVITANIDLQLRRYLGTGVDSYRALTDVHYMRDVLLVCDAMKDTNLPLLARRFRVASALLAPPQRPGHDAGPPQPWAADTSGFGVSQPPPLAGEARRSAPTPWFSPRRWFGSH